MLGSSSGISERDCEEGYLSAERLH
jgi:hypothetical protein